MENPTYCNQEIEQPTPSYADPAEAKAAYNRVTLNLMLYAVIGTVLAMLAMVLMQFVFDDNVPLWASYLSSFVPMYCVAFPIYLLVAKNQPKTVPEQHDMKIWQILLAFCMCEGIAIAGNYLGTMINAILSAILGWDTSYTGLEEGIFSDASLLFISIAVLIAPIIEEILFRKILIDRIRKYGDGIAIAVSGLLFGLFHGNLTQFFYAAGVGFLFAFIYVRTGKVRYSIILHMMLNFCGSALPFFFLKDLDIEQLNAILSGSTDMNLLLDILKDMIPYLIYVCFLYMIVITGIVLLCVFRKRFTVPAPEAPLAPGIKLKTICGNIGFILFTLYCVANIVITILSGMQLTE